MPELTLEPFAIRLVELLPKLMREIWQHEHNYLTRGFITLPQLQVLQYVGQQRTCQMRELVVALNVRFPALSSLVDRMVDRGLLVRVRSEEDRRVVHVTMTAKGKRILQEIYAQKRVGIMRLFGRLSARERADYLAIIEKLVRELASHSTSRHT